MSMSEKNKDSLRAVISPLKKGFLQVGFFSLFINMMMLVPPLYMLQVYDRVLTSRSGETLLLLTGVLVWMFLTLGLLEFVRSRIMVRMGTQVDALLNQRIYRSIMRSGFSARGSIGSLPLGDLANLRQFLSGSGVFAFFDTPWMPIYLGILFLINPLFGLFAVFAAALLFTIAVVNELNTRPLLHNASEQQALATRTVDAQMQNSEVMRALGMDETLKTRWMKTHLGAMKAQAEASDRAGIWLNLSKTLRLLFQSLMLGLGAYLAIDNQITPGMVIAGTIILGRALAPIDQMINVWKGFVSARVSYERLDQLLREFPEEEEHFSLPEPKGELSVDRLVLVPPGGRVPVLRGISFSLRRGEVLGLIGASAGGKTSLLRGILGLWPLASGSVRLDGADIAQWNPAELGPRIGYLPQDVELFEGTVAENIARFTQADEGHIVKAARIAGIDHMVRNLPDGYDTRIGPGGHALSGGQRQRIGLARAVFGSPRLIFLDEPNANLDTEGEKALSVAFRYLRRKGVTLMVVSHRRRILKYVDKILVIEQGAQQLFGPRDAVLKHMDEQAAAERQRIAAKRKHLRLAS